MVLMVKVSVCDRIENDSAHVTSIRETPDLIVSHGGRADIVVLLLGVESPVGTCIDK